MVDDRVLEDVLRAVFRYSHFRHRDHADAADVTQKTAERLVKSWPDFSQAVKDGRGLPYALQAASWASDSHFRSERRRRDEQEVDEDLPHRSESADELVWRTDLAASIRAFVAELPPKSREAVETWLEFDGDIDECTGRLGIEKNTFHQQLFRAKSSLRERLTKAGITSTTLTALMSVTDSANYGALDGLTTGSGETAGASAGTAANATTSTASPAIGSDVASPPSPGGEAPPAPTTTSASQATKSGTRRILEATLAGMAIVTAVGGGLSLDCVGPKAPADMQPSQASQSATLQDEQSNRVAPAHVRDHRDVGVPTARAPDRTRSNEPNPSPNVTMLGETLARGARVYATSGTPVSATVSLFQAQQPIPGGLQLGPLPRFRAHVVGNVMVFALGAAGMRCEGAAHADSVIIDCGNGNGAHALYVGAISARGTVVGETFAVKTTSGAVTVSHFEPGAWYLIPDTNIDWDTHMNESRRCVGDSRTVAANPPDLRHIADLRPTNRVATICAAIEDGARYCRWPVAQISLKSGVDVFGTVRADDVAVVGADVQFIPGTQTAWMLTSDAAARPNDPDLGFWIGALEGLGAMRLQGSDSEGRPVDDIELFIEEVVYTSRTTLVFPLLVGRFATGAASLADVFACLER